VSLKATRLAIRWTAFFEAHARKVYASELNTDVRRAHEIAELIEEKKVIDGMAVRDLYKNNPKLGKAEEVRRSLDILQAHHWLQLETRRGAGVRQMEVIRLNPVLWFPKP
jgi:hypothetical protein